MSKSAPKTLVDSSYELLRADIMEGNLASGARLRIAGLQEQYQSGAGPLREALNRLAGEGIVVANSQSGFSVSAVSAADLREVTRMRILLECEALKESMEKGDDEWEANIVAAFHRLAKASDQSKAFAFGEWELRNDVFHDSLVKGCTSRWLLRFRSIMYDQHKRYRVLAFKSHDRARDVLHEHELIKEAVLQRDIPQACRLIEEHIKGTMEITQELFPLKSDYGREEPAADER